MIKIAIITSTRADYGLLSPIIRVLRESSDINVKLIVTGTHLSQIHGMTINEIIADGVQVAAKIPFNLKSDQASDLAASAGVFTKELAYQFNKIKPDAAIILGDRFEMLPVAYTAAVMKIKLVHLHGGEITLGAVDNKIRFAISHLSDLHLTATKQSSQRLIQCGIDPETIIMVGALGVENALKIQKASRLEIEEKTGVRFSKQNILFTFHPETLSNYSVETQIETALTALGQFEGLGKFLSLPNADPGNSIIREKLINFKKHHSNVYLTKNHGHYLYLSIMGEVDAVVGNSSSGIIEAPALGVPTINIGDRQKGREQAESIMQCDYNSSTIEVALRKALSHKIKIPIGKHPYFLDGTRNKIVSAIKEHLS